MVDPPAEPHAPRRRAPREGERQRDPERTKTRILEAAKVEFGAKGYTSARVSDIADRAGINKQLISYYFGGKEGLYTELANRWRDDGAAMANPDQPLDAVVANFAMSTARDWDWARLMAWANLSSEDDPIHHGTQDLEVMRAQVADLRRRQTTGEVPADLDPALLLLTLFAAAGATVTLSRIAHVITGDDPRSAEFTQRYADHLARLVRHLQPPA